MSVHFRVFCAAIALAFITGSLVRADENPARDRPVVEAFLLRGDLAGGEKAISDHLIAHAGDQQAQFSLGVVQFLRGVERLSQAAYKHGLTSSDVGTRLLPIAKNPSPAEINYAQTRQIVQTFVEDVQCAEQTLAKVDTAQEVKLPLELGQIRLDLNGDGQADETETLAQAYVQFKVKIGGQGLPAALPPEDIDAVMSEDNIEAGEDAIVAPPGLEGDAPPATATFPQPADKPEAPLDPAVPAIGAVDDLFDPSGDSAKVPEIGAVVSSDLPPAEVAPPAPVATTPQPPENVAQAAPDDLFVEPGAGQVDAFDLPSAVPNRQQLDAQAKEFAVTLDGADVHWLRGCCQLLAGLGNVYLAHNTETLFNHSAHLIFPNAQTPYPFLKPKAAEGPRPSDAADLQWVDWVAAVHLVRLDVVEPARMIAARGHFLAAIEQNRIAWQRISAETDNDQEWIPSPRQTVVIPDMRIPQPNIDAWQTILGEADALLQGERLAPFWRGDAGEGVNVKRVFEEPRPLDLVLWVQGAAAVPYLEKGTLGDKELLQRLRSMFGENFIRLAMRRE